MTVKLTDVEFHYNAVMATEKRLCNQQLLFRLPCVEQIHKNGDTFGVISNRYALAIKKEKCP